MRITFIAIATLALAGQPALAQIQRYDPNSGKYYTSDPFAPTAPPTPNPYRLDASRTRNVASPIGQRSGGQVPAGMGAQVGATASASGSASSQQYVPLGDMAMYGDSAGTGDPFAKPDWWPQ